MSIIASIVEAVVRKLGEALIQPIFQEAIFLRGVGEKLRRLKDEFEEMQSFLEDADAKQLVDEGVKKWVQDVRGAANDAEDAIDIFAYTIAPLRQERLMSKLKGLALIFAESKAPHDLGRKIEHIYVKIADITRRRETYGIQSITGGEATQSLRRLSAPHVPEPDFIGFQEQSKSLIEHLIKRDRCRCAVSLVGMGGLGKTTLAKKAYNDKAVKNHFSTRAWISVSQQYSVRELLLYIAKQCSACSVTKLQGMNEVELSKIFAYLKNRTYLIVLDDIWNSSAWDDMKGAFPDESNGSRILLTTRNRDVDLYADVRSQTHDLPFLTEDESWQLLHKKAFPGQEVGSTPDLESMGREIAKKCGGVPLAIVVMGGLLLTKRREASEWQKALDSIRWQFGERENQVFKILSLSYIHLPYRMKPCFLYLALFPEDYRFPASRLIRLWAAEGFLQRRGHETPEEVGEDILMELISRNLIQVAEVTSSGLIKSCRIHDLLRDLCLSRAEEEAFLEVHQWSSTPSACKGRRLALHGTDASQCTYLNSSTPHLRSIFLFNENQKGMLERRQLQLLFTSFKMLRVLDLERVNVRELPCEIGKLVHLRYVRCSDTSIESLPSSMANLGNLQTLDVMREHVHGVLRIPSAVTKMLQQLRHLQLVTYVPSRMSNRYDDVVPYLSSNFFDIIKTSDMRILYEERISLEHSNQSSLASELSLIDKSFIANSSSPMPTSTTHPVIWI